MAAGRRCSQAMTISALPDFFRSWPTWRIHTCPSNSGSCNLGVQARSYRMDSRRQPWRVLGRLHGRINNAAASKSDPAPIPPGAISWITIAHKIASTSTCSTPVRWISPAPCRGLPDTSRIFYLAQRHMLRSLTAAVIALLPACVRHLLHDLVQVETGGFESLRKLLES